MDWEKVADDVLAGVLVAVVVATLGLLVAFATTKRWDRIKARQQRDQAAADAFYDAYGGFFAAWKMWAAYTPRTPREGNKATAGTPPTILRRARSRAPGESSDRPVRLPAPPEVIQGVCAAEGAFESFLVRLTHQRLLDADDLTRLWCFRRAYKELRYAVRSGRRLGWVRTTRTSHEEYRAYQAFKYLAMSVVTLLVHEGRDRGPLERDVAVRQLEYVTGPSGPVREAFSRAAEASKRRHDRLWIFVAEELKQPKNHSFFFRFFRLFRRCRHE